MQKKNIEYERELIALEDDVKLLEDLEENRI